MRDLRTIEVVALCVLGLACSGRRSSEAQADPAPQPVAVPTSCPTDAVLTSAGCVHGAKLDKLTVFRGIPYAAPPVGPLRWKPPAPAVVWKGVREASAFGKSCPQGDDTIGGKLDTDEDCLTVNVWTPSTKAGSKLPVMFWIHGGGFSQGGAAVSAYDGQHLATEGGVVVVSINYRLGPLGFLAHPALSAEDPHHASGNFGLLDQIAALAWVKTNIARFGGDPSTITIFGESAGGDSVCALMASPLAKGRFQRAIIESAQCVTYGKALRPLTAAAAGGFESAEAQGLRIAKAVGCEGDGAAACMRGKTPDELVHASPAAFGFLNKGEHFGLTVDGYALLDAPGALLAAGTLADVPTMIGTNTDEATLFTTRMQITKPGIYMGIVAKMFSGNARQVLAEYAPATFGSVKQAFDALVTDVTFTCPTRRAARALRTHEPHVYRYLFSHVTAKAAANHMGASHGTEIPFVFATLSSPTDDEHALAKAMLGYWTHFARTGEPSAAGAPEWPAYDGDKDRYLELQTPPAVHEGLRTAACDLLDSVAATQQPEN